MRRLGITPVHVALGLLALLLVAVVLVGLYNRTIIRSAAAERQVEVYREAEVRQDRADREDRARQLTNAENNRKMQEAIDAVPSEESRRPVGPATRAAVDELRRQDR